MLHRDGLPFHFLTDVAIAGEDRKPQQFPGSCGSCDRSLPRPLPPPLAVSYFSLQQQGIWLRLNESTWSRALHVGSSGDLSCRSR